MTEPHPFLKVTANFREALVLDLDGTLRLLDAEFTLDDLAKVFWECILSETVGRTELGMMDGSPIAIVVTGDKPKLEFNAKYKPSEEALAFWNLLLKHQPRVS